MCNQRGQVLHFSLVCGTTYRHENFVIVFNNVCIDKKVKEMNRHPAHGETGNNQAKHEYSAPSLLLEKMQVGITWNEKTHRHINIKSKINPFSTLKVLLYLRNNINVFSFYVSVYAQLTFPKGSRRFWHRLGYI